MATNSKPSTVFLQCYLRLNHFSRSTWTLICKNVVRFVSQFFQVWHAGILDHWWRTAEHHKDVVGRSWETFLDHVTGNKTAAVTPIWWGNSEDKRPFKLK